ncbi:hypothetical protein R3X27_23425 [Tropicimonas sp. TH_r6]|uniref:hypothetical protein n=1 Tax=Tropicimonas sp. TH_r6 TaxID=3082085 RepID=UPI0029530AFD|nr:hypothetical protein [Tropicimonas sp. TH_r6]MDV7145645.1 hypothetical protein [Tropicimonas sp. TH_r6]
MRSCPDHSDLLKAAVTEGVRWWFQFDGPQQLLIERNKGHITREHVRAIASTYNFGRNLVGGDPGVDHVVSAVNTFAGKTFPTYRSRAEAIAETVPRLQESVAGETNSGKAFRLVSGMTKLTWFVAPERWTPFDRLAAKAVGANNQDLLKRMKSFYEKLDGIGFVELSAAIAESAKKTSFAQVTGERILDKYLMFNGEPAWTNATLPMVKAYQDTLPGTLKRELAEFQEAVATGPAGKIDLGENR